MIIAILIIGLILLFCGFTVYNDAVDGEKLSTWTYVFGIICSIAGVGIIIGCIRNILNLFG